MPEKDPLSVGKDIFLEPTAPTDAAEPTARRRPKVPFTLIGYAILIIGILVVVYFIFKTSLGW